jgi:hypothetical protein
MKKEPGPTLFFENNAGQLLEESTGFLRANWSANARGPHDVQDFLLQMIKGLQKNNWARLLGDQTRMRSFTSAEQQWVAHEWLPRAVREGGYRHGAILVAGNVLTRLATAYITTNVQGLPLVYRSFETEAEAMHWLLQQPAHP